MQNKTPKSSRNWVAGYEATSGGGMVKAEVSGKQELRKITIDPKALEGGDVEMLQDSTSLLPSTKPDALPVKPWIAK